MESGLVRKGNRAAISVFLAYNRHSDERLDGTKLSVEVASRLNISNSI